jgi:hypothetical protein
MLEGATIYIVLRKFSFYIMEINEIVHKARIGDYFYVVTSYQGKGVKEPLSNKKDLDEVDVYHTTAYREIYTGPMSGVADYEGTRITSDEDIEGRHLEMCAVYKKRLEKGGEWEGHDRPLIELYEFSKEIIEEAKKEQDALEALEI